MRVIIDRIENETAVCELDGGQIISVPASLFDNPCEGAVYNVLRDEKAEQSRKNNAQERLNSLFGK